MREARITPDIQPFTRAAAQIAPAPQAETLRPPAQAATVGIDGPQAAGLGAASSVDAPAANTHTVSTGFGELPLSGRPPLLPPPPRVDSAQARIAPAPQRVVHPPAPTHDAPTHPDSVSTPREHAATVPLPAPPLADRGQQIALAPQERHPAADTQLPPAHHPVQPTHDAPPPTAVFTRTPEPVTVAADGQTHQETHPTAPEAGDLHLPTTAEPGTTASPKTLQEGLPVLVARAPGDGNDPRPASSHQQGEPSSGADTSPATQTGGGMGGSGDGRTHGAEDIIVADAPPLTHSPQPLFIADRASSNDPAPSATNPANSLSTNSDDTALQLTAFDATKLTSETTVPSPTAAAIRVHANTDSGKNAQQPGDQVRASQEDTRTATPAAGGQGGSSGSGGKGGGKRPPTDGEAGRGDSLPEEGNDPEGSQSREGGRGIQHPGANEVVLINLEKIGLDPNSLSNFTTQMRGLLSSHVLPLLEDGRATDVLSVGCGMMLEAPAYLHEFTDGRYFGLDIYDHRNIARMVGAINKADESSGRINFSLEDAAIREATNPGALMKRPWKLIFGRNIQFAGSPNSRTTAARLLDNSIAALDLGGVLLLTHFNYIDSRLGRASLEQYEQQGKIRVVETGFIQNPDPAHRVPMQDNSFTVAVKI